MFFSTQEIQTWTWWTSLVLGLECDPGKKNPTIFLMRVMRWDDGMFYAGWQTQPTEDSARVPVQAVGDYPLLMLVTRFIESNSDVICSRFPEVSWVFNSRHSHFLHTLLGNSRRSGRDFGTYGKPPPETRICRKYESFLTMTSLFKDSFLLV